MRPRGVAKGFSATEALRDDGRVSMTQAERGHDRRILRVLVLAS
jgi:hypothetical protein